MSGEEGQAQKPFFIEKDNFSSVISFSMAIFRVFMNISDKRLLLFQASKT